MPEAKATPVAETPKTNKPKTYTNWNAFKQAKLAPTVISCEGYKPVHLADISCHSKVLLKADNVKTHVDNDHGGGFYMQLAATERDTGFWDRMAELGLEAHDFRCDNCDKQLRFHPSSIIPHLKAHGGKTRRVYPGGKFNFTLSLARPEAALTDEDEDVA